ncbi:MAG: hypothetical protein M3419_05710 [Actinomycetota bacterium]|nr:hypothetical protein [Actinomycetota bacterium]
MPIPPGAQRRRRPPVRVAEHLHRRRDQQCRLHFVAGRWSLAHRDEFALIFANPVTAKASGADNACAIAGHRFGAYFADLFLQVWPATTSRYPSTSRRPTR